MSFADREQRLRQYFIETGLQEWEDTTHPPNELQLHFNVRKILFVLKKIKEKIDNNPEISLWKEAVLQLRQSHRRIGEWDYIRWMVTIYEKYLNMVFDIKVINRVMVDTIHLPLLSDPQGPPFRYLIIHDLLRSLVIIEDILQPIIIFTDVRNTNRQIRMIILALTHDTWNYHDYYELSPTQLLSYLEIYKHDLEQVFREENLSDWGTQGRVDEVMLQHLDRVDNGVKEIFDALHGDEEFWDWWKQIDRIRIEPDGLQTEDQLTFIREKFWKFQEQFHMLSDYWSIFIDILEQCAPYLSQPINEFDSTLLRRIQSALRTIGRYRIIMQPFIMVIKGLPFIVSGKIPATPIISGKIPATAIIPDEIGNPDCPICLSRVEDRAYTNTCLHEYCYPCIREWSQSNNRCPVCRKVYRTIVHNIRSNQDYDQEAIEGQQDQNVYAVPSLRGILFPRELLENETHSETRTYRVILGEQPPIAGPPVASPLSGRPSNSGYFADSPSRGNSSGAGTSSSNP